MLVLIHSSWQDWRFPWHKNRKRYSLYKLNMRLILLPWELMMEDLYCRHFQSRQDHYPTSGAAVYRFNSNECWSWFIWSDRTAGAKIQRHSTNYKDLEEAQKCADKALIACGYKCY
jgi:hypothetical protein